MKIYVSRIHTFKKGEIVSDLRNRYQGYRIKFKINDNQIKMYDKGNNLRIEVTIFNYFGERGIMPFFHFAFSCSKIL